MKIALWMNQNVLALGIELKYYVSKKESISGVGVNGKVNYLSC